jgi:transposase
MFNEWPQASNQFFPWRQVFLQPHPGARPVVQIAAIGGSIGRRRASGAVYSGSLRLENCSYHGIDHDFKPLPSPSRIRLPTRPLGPDQKSIEVDVRPREGSAAVCSECHHPAPGYDHLPQRCFEFIPLWGFLVFLLYRMRRVDCRTCGVVVEKVPWGDGKHQLSRAYMLFLARWARKLSWKETAEAFHTSWDHVCDAVEYVVGWGLEHRTLEAIRAIGVDEIQNAKGHKYLTLVYQIEQGLTPLLWVGKERTIASFQGFFTAIGEQFVCSDMWQPYLDLIRQRCSQALHILDRFHIVAKMNRALDDVPAPLSRANGPGRRC